MEALPAEAAFVEAQGSKREVAVLRSMSGMFTQMAALEDRLQRLEAEAEITVAVRRARVSSAIRHHAARGPAAAGKYKCDRQSGTSSASDGEEADDGGGGHDVVVKVV